MDFVLPPEQIAQELARLAGHPFGRQIAALQTPEKPLEEEGAEFNRILALLKVETGVDFTHYKHSTISTPHPPAPGPGPGGEPGGLCQVFGGASA